jgi:hypothetical protein
MSTAGVIIECSDSSWAGVDSKLKSLVIEVAKFVDNTIVVTSGLRTRESQALAMLGGWNSTLKDKNGAAGGIYSDKTLAGNSGLSGNVVRDKLTDYWNIIYYDDTVSGEDEEKAKKDFIELASKANSEHVTGQAVDLRKESVSNNALKILQGHLRCINEPNNQAIWHFDTRGKGNPPEVTEELKKKWQKLITPEKNTFGPIRK